MNPTVPKLFFLIPAFNEAENLVFLFSNIRRISRYLECDYHVILVNDGSTDDTADKARGFREQIPLTLISFEQNKGPGAAFLAAFKKALEISDPQDLLVTIEADNTSDLCILGKMREQLNRGSDLALASVYGAGKVVGAPLIRRILSYFANSLLRYTLGLRKINTFSSFFRMYRRTLVKRAFDIYGDDLITEPGFVCMVEMLIKFNLMDAKISEAPMLLDSNIRVGDSKMKIMKTTKSYFRVMGRHIFMRRYHPTKSATLNDTE